MLDFSEGPKPGPGIIQLGLEEKKFQRKYIGNDSPHDHCHTIVAHKPTPYTSVALFNPSPPS